MTMQFRIRAEAEPQCLSRLIDHFAQRGLIPSALSANRIGRALDIVIEHPTMPEETALLIRDRIAQMPSVEQASTQRLRA